MKNLGLVVTMLRYRVAALLLPFFLLAPALHGQLQSFRWSYLAGTIALCGSYVVATCLNDVFDLEIDRINHAHAVDRPLVSGAATPRRLIAVAIVSAAVALIAGAVIGPLATACVAASLLLNIAYSVPPVRLCARALAAPLMLAFAYVVLPYVVGLAASGLIPAWFDVRVGASFVVLFIGRMLLKDFRDRRGDAAFGKRTFLLSYGKPATLIAVFICIIIGNALLISALPASLLLVAVIQSYFAAILLQLYRLWLAGDLDDERVAIALGARMGNAVVLTLLGFVVLRSAGASVAEQNVLVTALSLMFWFVFLYVASRPIDAVAAYRG